MAFALRLQALRSAPRVPRSIVAGLALLLATAAGASADELFLAADYGFQTNGPSVGVAAADLDGDGHLDLVTGGGAAGTVSVLFGDGAGSFGSRLDVAAGPASYRLAIGDLNHDGHPDLAVTNFTDGTVSILLGNGDGTFAPRVTYPTGPEPKGLAIADLDADGAPDLAVTCFNPSKVTILLGNGDGTFGPRTDFGIGPNAGHVVVGDLDADGWPDLVIGCFNSRVSNATVLFGNGDGTFGGRLDLAVSARGVALGDVDLDGHLDIVTSADDTFSGLGTRLSILRGDGARGFAPALQITTGSSPVFVAIAELTGDAIPDLVAAHLGGVSVHPGLGGATYGSPLLHVSSGAASAAVADLDADGRLDVAVTPQVAGEVHALLGTGIGTFGKAILQGDPLFYAERIAIGDLDEDGRDDAVISNNTSVVALISNGTGSFASATPYSAGVNSHNAAIADLDEDGHLDLAVAGNPLTVRLGDGHGGFGARLDLENAYAVAIGDVNADGHRDLAFTRYPSGLSVRYGNGDGTFQPRIDVATASNPIGILARDVNDDLVDDLVVSNFGANSVSLFSSNGDGTFARFDFAVDGEPRGIAIGDATGDGRLDLLAANSKFNVNTVSLIARDAGGGFLPAVSIAMGGTPYAIATGDLDGDGRPDLVAANYGWATVTARLGLAGGGFGPPSILGVKASTPHDVAIADLTGDGRVDLLTANFSANSATVLLNAVGAPPLPVGPGPRPALQLSSAIPNPTAHGIRARLALPAPAPVDAAIHDASGRRVRRIASGRLEAGAHTLAWDGRREDGSAAGPGIYWLRVTAGPVQAVRKFAIVR